MINQAAALWIRCTSLALLTASCAASSAWGFLPGSRWTTTASGSTGSDGDPITLTWSFVPDGTAIPQENVGSNLISFLDEQFGQGVGGADLTQRPWFHFFEESFDRWSQLGGVTYVYEPRDDGLTHGAFSGAKNRRGDVRLGGAYLDGPGNTLAYNQLPNGGDMVIDTGDVSFFTSATADYVKLRNVIMHEHGHGLGINHVQSTSDALLMEPFINATFYGPQLDEVRAIHYYYGDVNEKSNAGLGNDIAVRATDMGFLGFNQTLSVGADANVPNQAISQTAVDFVSIDHQSDVDYYSFSVDAAGTLDVTLTPRGGVFNQAEEGATPTTFNANARADLVLQILDVNGTTVLSSSNVGSAGAVEQIEALSILDPGEYFARVSSLTDTVQLYQLDLSYSIPQVAFIPGDFDGNGAVDLADYRVWEQ
ncbi:MAG: pre-peptidase C-terminal domain-containing protein, partial [Planctomycetales bacterium]|nr:pre-peptidase C-terminal domain-containing protein [Planctomycetales bacterium]